jgi:cell shape-determining protein MreC
MSYLQKNKPKYRGWKNYIGILAFALFLGLFFYFFPKTTRTFFYTVSRPIWYVSGKIGISAVAVKDFFSIKSSLISRNQALEDEIATLRLKQIDYDILLNENEELLNEQNKSSMPERLVSRVLSKPPRSPYDTFVIDLGSKSGITLGSKVYLSNNIIIGKVTNLTPNTSLVRLFSSSGEKQEAIQSRTGTNFTLLGYGGGNLELEVPKDTDILWGDKFMYPNENSALLGSVYYIDNSSQSSFKTVYIRNETNVFSTKFVFIEKMSQ